MYNLILSDIFEELHFLYKETQYLTEILYADLYISTCSKKSKITSISSGFYFLLEPDFSQEKRKNLFVELYKNTTNILHVLHDIENHGDKLKPYKQLLDIIHTCLALKNKIPDISSTICIIKDDPSTLTQKHIEKKMFLFIEGVRALLEEISDIEKTILHENFISKIQFLTKEPIDLKEDFP